jgi:hypothetical protein
MTRCEGKRQKIFMKKCTRHAVLPMYIGIVHVVYVISRCGGPGATDKARALKNF